MSALVFQPFVGAGPGLLIAFWLSIVVILIAPVVLGVALWGRPTRQRTRRVLVGLPVAMLAVLILIWIAAFAGLLGAPTSPSHHP